MSFDNWTNKTTPNIALKYFSGLKQHILRVFFRIKNVGGTQENRKIIYKKNTGHLRIAFQRDNSDQSTIIKEVP